MVKTCSPYLSLQSKMCVAYGSITELGYRVVVSMCVCIETFKHSNSKRTGQNRSSGETRTCHFLKPTTETATAVFWIIILLTQNISYCNQNPYNIRIIISITQYFWSTRLIMRRNKHAVVQACRECTHHHYSMQCAMWGAQLRSCTHVLYSSIDIYIAIQPVRSSCQQNCTQPFALIDLIMPHFVYM